MNSFETKKIKSYKPLKKFFLGVSAVAGASYLCCDYTDFKNENPSHGPKEYAELKFGQLQEIRTGVCSFAQHVISTIEKPAKDH